jgi:hypothetical protein
MNLQVSFSLLVTNIKINFKTAQHTLPTSERLSNTPHKKKFLTKNAKETPPE